MLGCWVSSDTAEADVGLWASQLLCRHPHPVQINLGIQGLVIYILYVFLLFFDSRAFSSRVLL